MRTKDKINNIKKVNLLIEMRGHLINENPPYHMGMGDPVTAGKAQYGYLEGDSPELIGKEVWFHTNRHNIMYNKNGAFGVYGKSKRGKKDTTPGIIGYTNDILLGGDINFDISLGYHNIMRTTKDAGEMSKRSQVVGVGGVVQELPDDPVTLKDVAEEIKYNPFISDYFHTSDGSYKVLGAEFVYAEYRPDGSYSLHAINPIIEPFKMGEYNPI
tara:strand:+ start:21 stop:662 length:642 start_codon:yes stop_codon:yes gene_type:complete